jgi:hypothetical protein
LNAALTPTEPSGLIRAAAAEEPWATPELLAKHYANDALIAAVQSVGTAIDELQRLGASPTNTASRLRAAGIAVPRSTVTFAELRARLAGSRPAVAR